MAANHARAVGCLRSIDGSGTVGGSHRRRATVPDRPWGGETLLSAILRGASSTGGSLTRREPHGGRTWQAPRPLPSAASKIADEEVVRHANGQVSVAWTGLTTGNFRIRTSIDGGASFGPARLVGTTTSF